MKKNGLNVNPTYSNEMACAQFIAVIGDTLKQKTAADVGNATYPSWLMATQTSLPKSVILYSRILRKGRPVNIFNCLIGYFKHKFYFA